MANLTAAEQVFAERMLHHFLAGKSAMEAAAAVLDDDARLVSAVSDSSHQYQGFNNASHTFTDHVAKSLASALSDRVYRALRS